MLLARPLRAETAAVGLLQPSGQAEPAPGGPPSTKKSLRR